jgi:UDP-galactopyranose mutase
MLRQPDLLVFSHLRWDFVWQRPQQLLTRLASDRRVLFVEEPLPHDQGPPVWERTHPCENVFVFRPRSPIHEWGFHDEQMPTLRALLRQLLADEQVHEPDVWFYTPMALPLLQEVRPRTVIYDCMDELSAFRGAPTQMVEREAELLALADVVFTGGPSLYRARKDRHPNIHCFPSSVEVSHFGRARERLPEPADQAERPRPRLGFFGVIDERMDLEILHALGRTRPDWQIIMVGPVVKIDPAALPRYPNILYTGMRDYAELPAYLSGWDACLLPFARNESTRFISPTKTLEYMAAEKPVVSTPIADVVAAYRDIVTFGETPEEFVAACDRALLAPAGERETRTQAMRTVLASTSWDATADAMRRLIEDAGREPPAARTPPVVIVGAGPTGLSAAFTLGPDALLLEQHGRVGGWCRSVESNGFTFDYAGHIMFSADPYVHEMYEMLLGDNVHWQEREAWIFSKGVHTRYPFQGALYGLPPDVIKECVVGAIEARFGPLAKAKTPAVNGNGTPEAGPPRNFEEFIHRVWGAGIAKHFAIPYNRKLWAVPLDEMETSWLGGRVPLPNLEEMIEGALRPVPRPMGPNARFGYPLRGGFQALMEGFLPHLRGPVRLNARVAAVCADRRTLTLSDGTEVHYEQLISTMPLPTLVRLLGDEAPEDVRRAAAGLRHVAVRCVHLGIGREALTDKHWIYYPEDTVFHRVFAQGNASPHCNAPGGFALTCEITYSPEYKPLPGDGDELTRRCVEDCVRVGLITRDDPVWAAVHVDMPCAYVIYDHSRAANVTTIRDWLLRHDILLAGRYAEWEYFNSDHAFLAGKKAAETARERMHVGRAVPV